jgi:hypothetical protein
MLRKVQRVLTSVLFSMWVPLGLLLSTVLVFVASVLFMVEDNAEVRAQVVRYKLLSLGLTRDEVRARMGGEPSEEHYIPGIGTVWIFRNGSVLRRAGRWTGRARLAGPALGLLSVRAGYYDLLILLDGSDRVVMFYLKGDPTQVRHPNTTSEGVTFCHKVIGGSSVQSADPKCDAE